MRCFKTTVILIALLFTQSVYAQRTSSGEGHISIIGNWTISSVGGELIGGQYTMYGQWFAAIDFLNRAEKEATEKYYFPQIQFAGGYLYRVYGNKTRSFNVYTGADAFIGIELFDLYKSLSEPTKKAFINNGYTDTRFIFGLAPRVEVEYFFLRNLGLSARMRLPICFLTKFDTVAFEIGAGVKFNF